MTTENDPYWDDLGIAWRAVNSDSALLTARLRAQVKREMWRQRLGFAIGMLAALCGVAFGVAWLNEPTPGAKWIGVSSIVGIAAILALCVWVRAQSFSGDTETLLGMIEVSIAQARRRQRDDKAGYVGSGILLLIGGLIAYVCHSHLHFPLVQAMQIMAAAVVVATVGIALGYRDARAYRDREARFEYLKRTLLATEKPQ